MGNAFEDLTKNSLIKRKLEAPTKERRRLKENRQKQILRERSNASKFKEILNANSKRLDSKEVKKLLAENKDYQKASPEVQALMQEQYLSSVEGSSVRDPQSVQNAFLQHLSSRGDMTEAEMRASTDSLMDQNYPTSNKESRNRMFDALKLNIEQEKNASSGGSSGKSGKSKIATNKEISSLIAGIAAERELSKTPTTVAGMRIDLGNLDPAQSDIATIIGHLRRNGITDPAVLKSTMSQVFNANNTVNSKFDWREAAGQDAILDMARNSLAKGGVGNDYQKLDIARIMQGIADSGNPALIPSQDIVKDLMSFLPSPQEAAVNQGYRDAGGQGSVTTTPLPTTSEFDPTKIPVNRNMTGNALVDLGLVTPEQAQKLEQDAPGYQPPEQSGSIPIDFSKPVPALNLGGSAQGSGTLPAELEAILEMGRESQMQKQSPDPFRLFESLNNL